ncbi:MAG: molybdopterin-dependent oxidoreductase [Phycisphaerales bacterium]|nr:molybdopterin-dependent oxidoreductase [Phycisphaerales bacterium]
MPKINIDNEAIECRPGVPVLQAALEAGRDVPHYCYHPGLSIVASCRLCLMEMQLPHPKTGEMDWAPKLFPSCQTPVKDGMVVRFDSEKVRENQRECMEYFLLNHPLDCPVCDQAGECHLQDYSFKFGHSESRMVDQKLKNPKKDIGPRTLLYQDRCVMCSRCVRFADEVSGTHELCIVNRGSRAEIDVFPGLPLDNALQGNVVDICPVGSLLDKDFLFKQRVWFLKATESICPGCSTGCAIRVDHHREVVQRLKPRYNPGVNDWWMCDEGRFGFKYVHDPRRIGRPILRRGGEVERPNWDDIPEIVTYRFEQAVERHGVDKVAAVLSPMMACEEAWLLAKFIRSVAAEATLVNGFVPVDGDDQLFPAGCATDEAKFTIRREKCPNRRGVEMIVSALGGNACAFDEFVERAGKGDFAAVWIVGGYPKPWVPKAMEKAVGEFRFSVVQDMFPNALTEVASLVLPTCAWVEREGCFVNHAGRIQPFERAIEPREGAKRDGQYLFDIAGHSGLYTGERVREMMAAEIPAFAEIAEAPAVPVHQH